MNSQTKFTLQSGMTGSPRRASEAEIRKFERDFGHDLPEDYRQFLLAINGVQFGEIANECRLYFPLPQEWKEAHKETPQIYPPFEWPTKGDVFVEFAKSPDVLCGLGLDKDNALNPNNRDYGFHEVMPKDFLVIGGERNPGVICMGCVGRFRHNIYLWFMDFGEDDKPTQEEAISRLSFIAPTFWDFWKSLVPVEEERLVV